MVKYMYNSTGEWIAFRDGASLYDVHGEFLGYMAENGVDIADIEGRYFASIYYGDRVYRKLFAPAMDARYPGRPGRRPPPDFPGLAETAPVPVEAQDVPELIAA